MKKTDVPSELFVGAILRAYDKALARDPYKPVTCSAMWNHIIKECFQVQHGFITMFEWDTSRAQNINRVATIEECIRRGHVPGLRLNEHGNKLVVVRVYV